MMHELPEEIRRELAFRSSDVLAIPFSLFWCGFAIFWEHGVVSSGAPVFFTLWGIPFVLIGLYMVVGRFFFDAQQRSRTFYALTADRILIVSGVFARKIKSLSLNTLTDVSLTETRSGEGEIAFGPQNAFPSFFGGSGWPGAPQQSPRFEFVSNAKAVYEKIRGAQRGLRAT